jgi:hypothetical protein
VVTVAFLLTLLGLLVAPPARATPPLQLSRGEIVSLLSEGDSLAEQKRYQEAVARYGQAYQNIVSQIRGQAFSELVVPTIKTRSELAVDIAERIDKELSPEELRRMEVAYLALGLMPDQLQMRETLKSMLGEEVGGYYDPESKQMVLVREDDQPDRKPGFFQRLFGSRPAFNPDEQKTTLAHELTHALQDQLYDLERMQESVADDDDMELAFTALVEGDATLMMMVESNWLSDDVDEALRIDPATMRLMVSLMNVAMPMASGPAFRSAPPIVRETLTFPYLEGLTFAIRLTGWGGGFRTIHEAYYDPPLSTEQILHPEKYLGPDRDDPVAIVLPDAESLLGDGWEHITGNCLGELQMRVLLGRVPGGRAAAAGWGGDRYEVYLSEAGQPALIWYTVWDTELDAEEFLVAYQNYVRSRMQAAGGTPTLPTPRAESRSLDSTAPDALEQPAASRAQFINGSDRWRSYQWISGDEVVIVQGLPRPKAAEIVYRLTETAERSVKTFPTKPQLDQPQVLEPAAAGN